MKRDEFLMNRALGIGGSDAACALALDPDKTPRELYAVKTGEVRDFADNRFTRAGRVLEAAIANLFSEEYGVTLRRKHVPLVHPRFPFMRANLDRLVVGERAILEIKNVDSWVHRYSEEWGEADSDIVPMKYYLQVMHYLAVTGYDIGYLGALVGGNKLIRYIIERREDVIEMLVEGERTFWERVEKREPPGFDYVHPSTFGLMRRIYRLGDGRSIDLPVEANDWHKLVLDGRELEKEGKAMQEEGKARILAAMAGVSIGRLHAGGEYRYSTVARKAYEVPAGEYQTLRHFAKQTKTREVA